MKKSVKQSTMVIILNVLSILSIVAVIISMLNLRALSEMSFQASIDRYELSFNANRFMDGSAYLTNEVRAFAATGDMTHYDNYWAEINVYKNRDIGIARMKEIGITPEEQAEIDAMAALSNQLVPLESAAMDLRMEGYTEEAIEAVYGKDYEETISRIREIKEKFLNMLDVRAENHVEAINKEYAMKEKYEFILIVIVAALQFINVFLVMAKLIVPIKKLENEMKEIASGNLSSAFNLPTNTSEIGTLTDAILKTKLNLKKYIGDIADKLHNIADGNLNLYVDIDYEGDFAPIKASLSTIINSLNNTITQIVTTARQVSESSTQIAEGAQSLAQGSTEQAATVEQLSASIAEITQKTKDNADMAERTAALANSIMQNAEKGSRQMGEMTEAVKEINLASQSISKVIKVIDDIAFQTNILALNAAVEAARAGQHGKGFAVVAEEVRNLAAKSAEAAKDTGELIANSMDKAELGAHIADETATSLANIVSGINESTHFVNEIARSSEDQSAGISQINEGIDQVAKVVQQNSATAEESAAASVEMSGQSGILQQMITHFKLKQ